MKENKYHELDKQVSEHVLAKLLTDGVTEYPAVCDCCRGTGRDPMSDNLNWLLCSNCGGKGNYMVAV